MISASPSRHDESKSTAAKTGPPGRPMPAGQDLHRLHHVSRELPGWIAASPWAGFAAGVLGGHDQCLGSPCSPGSVGRSWMHTAAAAAAMRRDIAVACGTSTAGFSPAGS